MENMLSTVVHSFTKDRDYTVCISNNFLTPEDHILFIDDFLAYERRHGNGRVGGAIGSRDRGYGFYYREGVFKMAGTCCVKRAYVWRALAIIDNLDDCKITVR